MSEDFVFEIEEEEELNPKRVILIYGEKGSGKTTVALSFREEIGVLSFDRKSLIIKATRYNNAKRIHVYDITKWMDYTSPESTVRTAQTCYVYALKVLDKLEKMGVDWIVIDGAEIFQQICEWTMRARHNLSAFQGVPNLSLWKERRILLRNIHNRALNIAKKGIIYTTYTSEDVTIKDGTVISKRKTPKWLDVLVSETDIVLETIHDRENNTFLVRVDSSKDENFLPTGEIFDVTNKDFYRDFIEKRLKEGRMISSPTPQKAQRTERKEVKEPLFREVKPDV